MIYAYKNMLTVVSETFNSMLSERWTTKDEPIKIADYSYDDFYQFLTFLYSGQCELTNTNISNMIDIAEFYGVTLFKSYCNDFLLSMKLTIHNIFQMMDLADKYSIDQFKNSIKLFITNNFSDFVTSVNFLTVKKAVMYDIVLDNRDKVKSEDIFQAVSVIVVNKISLTVYFCHAKSMF